MGCLACRRGRRWQRCSWCSSGKRSSSLGAAAATSAAPPTAILAAASRRPNFALLCCARATARACQSTPSCFLPQPQQEVQRCPHCTYMAEVRLGRGLAVLHGHVCNRPTVNPCLLYLHCGTHASRCCAGAGQGDRQISAEESAALAACFHPAQVRRGWGAGFSTACCSLLPLPACVSQPGEAPASPASICRPTTQREEVGHSGGHLIPCTDQVISTLHDFLQRQQQRLST